MANKVASTNEINIIAGLDIGNGYVKGKTRSTACGDLIHDIPSCVSIVTQSNGLETEDPSKIMDDLMNNLDASFDSKLIPSASNRRLFGKRAIASGLVMQEFDVYSHLSKAKQELTPMLTLGTLAATALREYYKVNKALPSDILQVHVPCMSVALPIDEFKKYRNEMESRYTESDHVVCIHNFVQPVRIQIHFDLVRVFAEGGSAQYAIATLDKAVIDAMLDDAKQHGFGLSEITSEDIRNAKDIIGIDIGEGTTNFPVYTSGELNPDASHTFDEGYGSVLNRAIDRLEIQGFQFRNRKELANFLQTKPTAFKKARYDAVMGVVMEEIVGFAEQVTMEYKKIMARVGATTEVTYVYGGGASPIRQVLYPKLCEASVVSESSTDVNIPVFYLDSTYSRLLNREGLFKAALAFAGQS